MENEWSIAIEGQQIFDMPEKDRWAKIIEAPKYKRDEQAPNAEVQKLKLICLVQLSDGRKAQYYMNRTSARFIAGVLKTDLSEEGMSKWINHIIVWGNIVDQRVGKEMKKVLYVNEVREAPKEAAQPTPKTVQN